VLLDQLGVGGMQRCPDRERDDERVIKSSDDWDEVGDQVDAQREVAGERAQPEPIDR
jgi:hypothetical protein